MAKITYIEKEEEGLEVLKDNPRERVLKLWDNEVRFKSHDPYGFWKIHMHKGNIPAELKGEYTTYDEAVKAAKNYYENKKGKFLRDPEKI